MSLNKRPSTYKNHRISRLPAPETGRRRQLLHCVQHSFVEACPNRLLPSGNALKIFSRQRVTLAPAAHPLALLAESVRATHPKPCTRKLAGTPDVPTALASEDVQGTHRVPRERSCG